MWETIRNLLQKRDFHYCQSIFIVTYQFFFSLNLR